MSLLFIGVGENLGAKSRNILSFAQILITCGKFIIFAIEGHPSTHRYYVATSPRVGGGFIY